MSTPALAKPLDPEEDARAQQALKERGNLPRHIAIIMDGDRRWAAERKLTMEELERAYIIEILKLTRGSMGKTATILGIHRKTLLEKRRRYGIDEERRLLKSVSAK